MSTRTRGRKQGAAARPTFFATPADFRAWLAKHHATADVLLVGFYKRDTGKPSITWPESVDEALCFGWIDGVRHSLGAEAYTIRFTPRRPRSIWSAVNIGRVKALVAERRMQPAGLKAFEARQDDRSAIYAYEQRKTATLTGPYLDQLKANAKAWAHFQQRPPGYQHLAAFWVLSAKQEPTRQRRLAALIAACAAGRPIGLITPPAKKPPARPRPSTASRRGRVG
jgi:uncharacterized protein YdeI (YjbR/CyaY-like superfamily)